MSETTELQRIGQRAKNASRALYRDADAVHGLIRDAGEAYAARRTEGEWPDGWDQSRFVNALEAAEGLSEAIAERIYWVIGDAGEEEAARAQMEKHAA